MPYVQTSALNKILQLNKRIRGVQGGTSASKTIGILQDLIDLAQRDKVPTLTSIVSESFPHLRRGAMRDWELIMMGHNYFKDARWDKTNSVYTYETGSKFEFFSVDQPEKVRGARRDRLFINEANNIPFTAFEELEVRTKDLIYLDWNPVTEFWWDTDIVNKRTDYQHLILNYKDNEGLSPEIIASIEQRKNRKGWWQVYGLGLLGEVEGKIYKDWEIIDELPHEAKLLIRYVDFGYTNDPTAIGEVYQYNGAYILNELTYQKGLSNRQIADILLNQESPECLVIADSAEPKSIDEIHSYGVNIQPSEKGRDSVVAGIQLVQALRISMTKRSVNIIKEYRNYLWMTDRDGRIVNIPEGFFNHHMDGARYAFRALFKESQYSVSTFVPDL